jgi:hypothetical protein
MLVWANCHGGVVLGWVAMAAYSAELLYLRLRGGPKAGDVRLWAVCGISILLSGLNPNGFQAIAVLMHYRESFLTSRLFEWAPPKLWPPTVFSALLAAAALVLLFRARKVRISDWLLFLPFAAAALNATRNEFLIGLLAPILLAVYLPGPGRLSRYAPRMLPAASTLALAAALVAAIITGQGLQFRSAAWGVPSGPADFLLANHITQPMLNTYEDGGYLIWKLWPNQKVFIDGRALSERVFNDSQRMFLGAGDEGGESAGQLLDKYGIEAVSMSPFEYTSGVLYMLAPELDGMDWKLVYAAADGMVFLRHAPAGMPVLDSSWIRDAMESGCQRRVEHQPELVGCAYNLGHMFLANGETENAIRFLGIFLEHSPVEEPKTRQEYQRLLATRK